MTEIISVILCKPFSSSDVERSNKFLKNIISD